MKKTKVICICASAAHYKEAVEIEKELKKLGFEVKIPDIAKLMEKTNNYNVENYKTWFRNKKDYAKKTKWIKDHFEKIIGADSILVANFEKYGLTGYIGGNVLMEMAIAFHYKKEIYIYNVIAEDLPIKEEIFALKPIFLNGDLTKI